MLRNLTTAAVLLAAMPALAQQKVDERRPASKTEHVEIENAAGSIKVVGWNRDEITVTGTLGRGAEGLEIDSRSGRTEISVAVSRNPHGVRSDLEIHVPSMSRVNIDGFAAAIDVQEVAGSVAAETVNGSIRVACDAQKIEAQSVNGDVDVSGRSDRVHVESVNGRVGVRGTVDALEATSVNGAVEVDVERVKTATFETVSGPLRFEGSMVAGGSLDVSSVSGDVTLSFAGDTGLSIDATSFSGEIETNLGEAPKQRGRYTGRKELQLTVGGGGADVSANTLSGKIEIRASKIDVKKE
jgi:DUF4097 and DUF4098 domain-containing protein YvlB